MRVVIQRCAKASVSIDNKIYSHIEQGAVILVGVEPSDSSDDVEWLTSKISKLRIFDDENGVMNLDINQAGGSILAVSQFTLYASTKKGNRPSYIRSAPEPISRPRYQEFVDSMQTKIEGRVLTGIFGADMKVELINDGPVTICIDSKARE